MFLIKVSMIRLSVATLISGYLSLRLFVAADPKDRNRTLTIFLSTASSFKLLMSAAILGCCCCVTVLNISFTEIEYFAFAAVMKRSHHSSHSVLGAASAESQKDGNPDTADPPDVSVSPPVDKSRSVTLKSSI